MRNEQQEIIDDEIDLRELFSVIKKNSLLIVFITAITILLSITYIYFTKSSYSSSSIVKIDQGNKGSLGLSAMLSKGGLGFLGGSIGGSDAIEQAKVILKSKKFFISNIDDLNMSTLYYIEKNFRKIELEEFPNIKIDINIKNRELYNRYFKITPSKNGYTLEIDSQDRHIYNYDFNKTNENRDFKINISLKDGIDPYEMNITTGNIITNRVDALFDSKSTSYFFKVLDLDTQFNKISKNIKLDDSIPNILKITYQDTTPQKAQEVTESITRNLIDYQRGEIKRKVDRNLAIVDLELNKTIDKLKKQSKKIEKYQKSNNPIAFDSGKDILSDIYSNKQKLEVIKLQIDEIKNSISSLKNGVVLSVALTSVGINMESMQNLINSFTDISNKIRELELQRKNIDKSVTSNEQIVASIKELKEKKDLLDIMLRDFTPKHPQVLKQRREIGTLTKRIRSNIEINLKKLKKQQSVLKSSIMKNLTTVENSLYQKVKYIKKDIKQKESILKSIPKTKIDSRQMYQNYGFNEEVYKALLTKKIDIDMSKTSIDIDNQILEDAYIAQKPDKPKVVLILAVSVIVGLILAIFIVFIKEFFSNRVKSVADLEKITNIPIYGTLPTIGKRDNIDEHTREIRANLKLNTPYSEAIKILISSYNKKEGKSTLSLNFANEISASKANVLLIDLNFDNPSLHTLLKVNTKIESSKSNPNPLDAVVNIKENLDFIPLSLYGIDATNMLMNESFNNILKEFESRYEYIILDASVLSSPYTKILLKVVDALLVVVKLKIAKKDQLISIDKLKDLYNLKSVGVIVNI